MRDKSLIQLFLDMKNQIRKTIAENYILKLR